MFPEEQLVLDQLEHDINQAGVPELDRALQAGAAGSAAGAAAGLTAAYFLGTNGLLTITALGLGAAVAGPVALGGAGIAAYKYSAKRRRASLVKALLERAEEAVDRVRARDSAPSPEIHAAMLERAIHLRRRLVALQ